METLDINSTILVTIFKLMYIHCENNISFDWILPIINSENKIKYDDIYFVLKLANGTFTNNPYAGFDN